MQTKKMVLYTIVTIILVSSIVLPQSKTDKIDQLLNRYLEYRLFNGSALVADNGEVDL